MSNLCTIGVKAIEVGAGDSPTSSPHASRSPSQHSWTRSWSLQHHSQSSRSSSSSSGSSSRSGSASDSKAPDKISPPFSYMEERGVFRPLDTIVNPLGLCRFYQTDPQQSNVITSPKSAASAHRIKCLFEMAKDLGWPLTIVVFKGGNITPLGLLQELYS